MMADLPELSQVEGFDWDRGNAQKNWQRHGVVFTECEEVFFSGPVLFPDPGHSSVEPRYFALGQTVQGRLLAVVFTMRGGRIRVISARDMSRKERRTYAKEIQRGSQIQDRG
ncbi:MAG: BrnT family toxin [Candidatus Omnitrophica bacterium]|nr:BrnT family toxin [Candidatus Omnitrophota bacterium]